MDPVRYEHGTGGSVISEHEVIEVRVARRVLWVGADAFPIANITRVSALSMAPARAAAVSAFVKFMVLLALVTAGGVTAFRDADGAGTAVGVAAATIAAILAKRLFSVLTTKTYYVLVIETGGAAHPALVSLDIAEVQGLVLKIMDAIDDPNAAFAINVQNHIGHIGDNIDISGGTNVTGKK